MACLPERRARLELSISLLLQRMHLVLKVVRIIYFKLPSVGCSLAPLFTVLMRLIAAQPLASHAQAVTLVPYQLMFLPTTALLKLGLITLPYRRHSILQMER